MDLANLVRPNILNLEPYHSAREKVQEGILLDANENPYPHEWRGLRLNRYPDPYQRKLRGALAEYLGVSPENLLAGAGSDEVLDWIFKVFCQPGGDRVAVAEPTYGMYRVMADIFGIPVFPFPLGSRFELDAETFLRSVDPHIKALFLCSPNNPTGNLLDRDEILKICRIWGKIVVVDEAYVEFSDAPSLIGEIGANPNLIVLRTLSKAFARAALRLGYAVADTEIISFFMKVKAPYNLNAITMEQGCEVLKNQGARKREVDQIRKERERLAARLREFTPVEEVFPSEANFLLFRCRRASAICQELLAKGIVVRDRSGPITGNCIRVTVGTPEENALFLEELQKALEVVVT